MAIWKVYPMRSSSLGKTLRRSFREQTSPVCSRENSGSPTKFHEYVQNNINKEYISKAGPQKEAIASKPTLR